MSEDIFPQGFYFDECFEVNPITGKVIQGAYKRFSLDCMGRIYPAPNDYGQLRNCSDNPTGRVAREWPPPSRDIS